MAKKGWGGGAKRYSYRLFEVYHLDIEVFCCGVSVGQIAALRPTATDFFAPEMWRRAVSNLRKHRANRFSLTSATSTCGSLSRFPVQSSRTFATKEHQQQHDQPSSDWAWLRDPENPRLQNILEVTLYAQDIASDRFPVFCQNMCAFSSFCQNTGVTCCGLAYYRWSKRTCRR